MRARGKQKKNPEHKPRVSRPLLFEPQFPLVEADTLYTTAT